MSRFLLYLFILLSSFGSGMNRRNNSLMSNLVRLVLSRSKYNKSNNEGSRVTQAPMVKMHLEKTKLPIFFYHTHKRPQDEMRLQRLLNGVINNNFPLGASELDSKNSKNKDVDKLNSMIGEMEIFEVVPLKLLNAHNFTEDELKKMPDNGETREIYEYLFVESPESRQDSTRPVESKQT